MYDVDRPKTLPAFAVPIMLAMFALLVALIAGAQQPPSQENAGGKQNLSMNEAEKAFAEQLSNVVLTGRFTTDGRNGDLEPEKYHVISATKTGKHDWIILARISYGGKDMRIPAIPIPVKVHWANDTPILSLTDLTIPGFGTFTSRVMFFEDRYAGTWQHGDSGGHLFGTISKADEQDSPEAPAAE